MPAKQLKMNLLQVFSEMTTQRTGFGQNSCAADKHACVFDSSVLKIFMINGLNFQNENAKHKMLLYDFAQAT